jgi:hypothetical protein
MISSAFTSNLARFSLWAACALCCDIHVFQKDPKNPLKTSTACWYGGGGGAFDRSSATNGVVVVSPLKGRCLDSPIPLLKGAVVFECRLQALLKTIAAGQTDASDHKSGDDVRG